ncbi:hypothetical protein CDD83_11095 [Cordyceps sp. RAO-2017]|nr:hypothetical protein CDD83_11095 [Cordyceps sp. RAO-2017]
MKQLLVALAALAAASPVAAGTLPRTVAGAYVVDLDDEVDVNGFAEALQASVQARIRRRMDYELYKGVAIELDGPPRANQVAAMAGVRKMWPVEEMSMGADVAGSPRGQGQDGRGRRVKRSLGRGRVPANDSTAEASRAPHAMMQIDRLHGRGITGKGSRIAIIDTGVDYEHPALGGCFGRGCVVAFGADLVGGEPTPRDCHGHGTVVAGLIAARRNEFGVAGAAPGAELGMYRVSCDGSFATDVLVDALYRAQRDGATIVNLSAGTAGRWESGVLAEAASRLAAHGIVCVRSAGNNGQAAVFSLDGLGPGVVYAGSMNSAVVPDLQLQASYAVDGGGDDVPFPFWDSDPLTDFTGAPMELWPGSRGPDAPDDADCGPLPDDTPDLADRIVLVRLCQPFEARTAARLVARGARRVLAYHKPADGPPVAAYFPEPPEGIVAFSMVEADVARLLLDAAGAGRKVLVTVPHPRDAPLRYRESPDEAPGAVTAFSSWGPGWDLALRPSLTAIGTYVLSTSWRDQNPAGFEQSSGTSCAAPQVAAIVALIAEARGSLDPAVMESLLVTHAQPQLYHDGDNFLPHLAPVAQQGGGLVRAYDAAYATTVVDPPGLNFNDTEHFAPSREFSLQNLGHGDVTYTLSHVPAVTVYLFTANGSTAAYPGTLEPVEAPASLDMRHGILTIPSKQSATVRVTAAPPERLDARRLALWSGWIAVNGTDGSSLSIPYQGFSGSIREHQVLRPDAASLAYQNGSVGEDSAIKLPPQGSADDSELILHIDATLGSPLVRADVERSASDDDAAESRKAIGQLHGFPFRHMPPGTFDDPGRPDPDLYNLTHFKWNGLLDTGSYAPEGSYKLVVRALRIFGDPEKKDDWDMSETPRFHIAYAAGSTTPAPEPGDKSAPGRPAGSEAGPCKSTDFPGTDKLVLNSETGYSAQVPAMAAAVCHGERADQAACGRVEAAFHANDPVSNAWSQYNGDACLPRSKLLETDAQAGCKRNGYPRFVANATTREHVQDAIRYARENAVRLSIKNTGHDYLGRFSGPNSLSIWTHHMDSIVYNKAGFTPAGCDAPVRDTVKIGAGVQTGALYRHLQRLDEARTFVGGRAETVGVAGFAMGGGHSILTGQYGLGADQVVEMELVLADGRALVVSGCAHRDLFWALRGGGGSTFGVVTSLIIKTFPMPRIVAAEFDVAAAAGPDVDARARLVDASTVVWTQLPKLVDQGVNGFIHASASVDDPSAKTPSARIRCSLAMVGPDASEQSLQRAIDGLLDAVSADKDGKRTRPVRVTYRHEPQNYPTVLEYISSLEMPDPAGQNMFFGSKLLSGEKLVGGAHYLRKSTDKALTSPTSSGIGAIIVGGPGLSDAARRKEASAHPGWEHAVASMFTSASFNAKDRPSRRAAVDQVDGTLQPLRELDPESGSHASEAFVFEPQWRKAYWGANYDRLRQIKKDVDPADVFCCRRCVGNEAYKQNRLRLCTKTATEKADDQAGRDEEDGQGPGQ